MIRQLERFRAQRPELTAKVSISSDFRSLAESDVSAYADDMMDSRIALVPRGTVAESYRLFEAWRYGCVVICEPLPPRPFLQGAPVIALPSWRELGDALGSLLDDRARQKQLHEASLGWWQAVCSEPVVGARLADELTRLRERITSGPGPSAGSHPHRGADAPSAPIPT
jgi:hypothetical protein